MGLMRKCVDEGCGKVGLREAQNADKSIWYPRESTGSGGVRNSAICRRDVGGCCNDEKGREMDEKGLGGVVTKVPSTGKWLALHLILL